MRHVVAGVNVGQCGIRDSHTRHFSQRKGKASLYTRARVCPSKICCGRFVGSALCQQVNGALPYFRPQSCVSLGRILSEFHLLLPYPLFHYIYIYIYRPSHSPPHLSLSPAICCLLESLVAILAFTYAPLLLLFTHIPYIQRDQEADSSYVLLVYIWPQLLCWASSSMIKL